MNFITKNLGWILLLIFFIFMLFIISSNDPQKVNFASSGVVDSGESLSGGVDKNLDELMKLIDNEDIQEEEKNEESEETSQENSVVEKNEESSNSNQDLDRETIQGESSTGSVESNEDGEIVLEGQDTTEEDKKGFFARLFGKDDSKDEVILDASMSGSELLDAEVVVIQSEKTETQDEPISDNDFYSNSNIIKVSFDTPSETYVDSEITYPGTNLETQVGKVFEIGVEMLKLNNKSFTQTLELMNKGDKVKQMTEENMYGCFNVEVLATGSNGYVCKKYLAEEKSVSTDNSITLNESDTISNDIQNEVEVATAVNTSVPKISTEIGSYYKIAIDTPSFFDVILERFTLQKGDVLRQTSNPNPNTGCVSMKVVGTTTGEHDGEVVSICSPDMVVSI